MKSEHTNMVSEVKVTLEEKVAPKPVINAVHHMDTKNAQHLEKKCHKCGIKNHFSSCCRFKKTVGQGQGHWDSRKPSQGWSAKRHYWPSRGKCLHSRSWSRSSGLQTQNTHSIEINWYDDDSLLKTFNTIYRSRSVKKNQQWHWPRWQN